jgi:hypothetical protein
VTNPRGAARFRARTGTAYVRVSLYRAADGRMYVAGQVNVPGGRSPRLVRTIGLWQIDDDELRSPEQVMQEFFRAAGLRGTSLT